MNATSLYVSTCRLVLQANPEDPGCWADLYRLIPYLRQSLSCTVCGNLLIEPYTPTETNCQHHVCRSCKGGKKKLKPSCSWCKNYERYVENVQLRILLQCYKKLCEYIINSSIFRLMCKTTASGDTNIANMTDLIQEGAGFKDEFKSNSGLSKSAYSILPCIYASASTQTITQAINLNNDSDIAIDEDVSVAKSNLSNGSSIYSVTYAGSGNKMVIKRKAMLNKGEMENCENLRLIKGSNFKRPIHRRGNFRGRGRGFKEEEKTNSTGVSNCTVSSNNVNSGRVNMKKKKLGCRCGNATASPGKLTCCGQRCPCYVDSKACLDCKCRGCRNPHTKEGQKVIRDPIESANSKLQSTGQLQTDEGIPAKDNVNTKTESWSSINHEKKFCDLDSTESGALMQQKEIQITVKSIENVDEDKVKEVVVIIDFSGNTLAQSFQTPIYNKRADIELTATINAENVTPEFMNEILCNPVLFTVLDCTVPPSISHGTSASPSGEKEAKKKVSKSSTSPASGSKSFMQNTNVLGICNLDIGSLVTDGNFIGKKIIRETLLVESEKRVPLLETVVWGKLAKLVVVASAGDEPLSSESFNRSSNVLGITVESVFNVPDYISEGTIFDASIPVPTIGEKTCRIKFPNGVVTSTKDFPCRKKWVGLSQIEGPGARSKARISSDSCDVISDIFEDDLKFYMNTSRKMIRWNMCRNCLMFKTDVSHFYSKTLKYNVWPVEILVSNKSKDQIQKDKSAKSDKKSKPLPSASVPSLDHFTAFLNLSPLLYPGVSKVRVAAQLFTYSQGDLINIFGTEYNGLQSQTAVGNAKTKPVSERSKASIKEPEENKEGLGAPVFNDEQHPTFIVVEVELQKPLCLKRDEEQLEEQLKAHLSLKGTFPKKTTNLDMIENIFSQSIMDVVSTLTQEYQRFSLSNENNENSQFENDISFYEHLCKRKNFFRVKTTLERRIVDLIKEKYGTSFQYYELLPEIYIYLVNEIHKITNSCSIGEEDFSCPHFNNGDLQLYAEEAFEEGNYQLAKEHLYLKLSRNTSNSDYWLDIAIYYIRMNEYEEALEAIREALCLNFYHQIGLLMYALVGGILNNFSIAEMAFEVLLTKYPDFVEGWMALRIFYISVGNTEGSVVAHTQARTIEYERQNPRAGTEEKSTENSLHEFALKSYPTEDRYQPAREEKYGAGSFRDGVSTAECLSWTATVCPPGNIRMRTIILLQKLGFYKLASVSLSDDLLSSGRDDKLSQSYVYYSSVNNYLQGRYEEAVLLLQEHIKEYGKDCFIWSLLGHCYYKLRNHEKAIDCYEYVMQTYNRPDDIHLVYLRMGFYYLGVENFSCAKQVLKKACKYSPTPKLWKGVGIACLMTEEMEEAEIAFTEANYLDNKDPDTWAYLAITNSIFRRLDLFKQCFLEAKKRGLQNLELIRKIECCATANGLIEEEFKF